MSLSAFLQVLGGLLELGGIVTVGLGISDTRAKFKPGKQSLTQRFLSRFRRVADRVFRRRRSQIIKVGTASSIASAGTVRVRGSVGFGPWAHENIRARVERLREAIQHHDHALAQLHSRIDDEEKARSEADAAQVAATDALRQELTELVRDAAAGGLRLETIGVSFFAAGVGFQTWGNILGS